MTTSNTPYAELVDADLVKLLRDRADFRLEWSSEGTDTEDGALMRQAVRAIEALEAEVGKWRKNAADATAQVIMDTDRLMADADRRVEEEREACAKIAEHFTGNLWDADENALARRITDAIRYRSNATGEDKAPSPVGFSDEEAADWISTLERSILAITFEINGEVHNTFHSHIDLVKHAPALLDVHLSAQRKEMDDGVTAQRTAPSPISQEGSIAPEALSEATYSDGTPVKNVQDRNPFLPDEKIPFDRPPVQTGAVGSVPDNLVLRVGDLLMERVNGPEGVIYRAARDIIAMVLSASPTPPQAVTDVGGGEPSRAPDGYSTDDEGGLLEDLLDGYDHGAITELTPYWCGERQWAVVHYDENGFADHRLFDSQDEARKFRDSTLLTNPNTEERGAVSGQDSGSSNCALEPTGAGASLSDGGE